VLTEAELAQILPALVVDAPVTITLVDLRQRICYVNRIEHGFRLSEVEGIRVEQLLPAADRERVTGVIAEVLATGVAGSYENQLLTPVGLARFFTRVGAVKIAGEIRYASLVSHEITREHSARQATLREHALLAALERINRVLAAPGGEPMFERVLSEMLSLFDCDRAFLAYPCDPEASEFSVVYEQTVPAFPGAKGRVLPVDPWIAERFRLALQNIGSVVRNDPVQNPLPEGPSAISDYQLRSMLFVAVQPELDKPWLLGIHHCREVRVYDAEIPLLAALAARIADGLRAWTTQQAMRQSEARFRLLVEHAPEAIVILDAATAKFVEVNSKAVELFGVPRAELLQLGPLDLSPARQPDGSSSAERAGPLIAAALAGESPVFEWVHQHASGAPLECEVRLLHLPHPEQPWVRGSILHIADRKRAERENERLSAQLAQAQKMQAIGHLTGGVAHDFNNLLTVISGSLEMMELEAQSNENLRSFGESALDACRRAAALTQRLLAFSRQQPLRPTSVNVEQLLRGMEGLLGRTLGETIRIEITYPEGLWPCEVDSAQLESAILNLSINARDAMPAGGVLRIEAGNAAFPLALGQLGPHAEPPALTPDEELSGGDYVVVSVSDDGSGIEPHLLSKVFEPFFTTKEVGKGSGLGLSMVYGFAKQSRGHVRIQSQLGRGTTIKLLLPRSAGSTVPEPVRETPVRAPQGDRELVLVVEDDAQLRALVVELLRRLGYRTLAAGDAASALRQLAESDGVAMLLADMVLPGGMNGAELAKRAKALVPGLPVLFMSGYTENAVIHDGRLDAGVQLLEKPFTSHALASAMRKALTRA
jgi:PAS domain S-box-containing protein